VLTNIICQISKRKDYAKYHDKNYLRTLEIPELQFLAVGADDLGDINLVLKEKKAKF